MDNLDAGIPNKNSEINERKYKLKMDKCYQQQQLQWLCLQQLNLNGWRSIRKEWRGESESFLGRIEPKNHK